MLYNIHLPEVKEVKSEKNIGVFSIEPLYPGYGMTLGNSLRRVVLSSLEGSAVTAVKIDGVSHEYTTMPNVKEDVVDIILNLKQLRVKSMSEEPVYLTLSASGEGEVKAKDIKPNADVEVINGDLTIAHLSSKTSKLNMEIKIENGRGYVPVEKREGEKLEVGMIAIDALYTPVKRVRYNVESTRVGQMTNLDKLVFEVETDGSITPRETIEKAAKILVEHFLVISGKETVTIGGAKKEGVVGDDGESSKILLEEINLSPRTTNALLNNDLKTVDDILKIGNKELKGLKGFGSKAFDEVVDKIKDLGFDFADADGEEPVVEE